MYQREAALERAAGHLFRIYGRLNGLIAPNLAHSSRSCQRVPKRPAFGNGTGSIGNRRQETPGRTAGRCVGTTTILGGQAVADTFDFVVVGGGSGVCAVAGRLSEDPQTSVALLEAGGRNDNWVVTTPGALC